MLLGPRIPRAAGTPQGPKILGARANSDVESPLILIDSRHTLNRLSTIWVGEIRRPESRETSGIWARGPGPIQRWTTTMTPWHELGNRRVPRRVPLCVPFCVPFCVPLCVPAWAGWVEGHVEGHTTCTRHDGHTTCIHDTAVTRSHAPSQILLIHTFLMSRSSSHYTANP